MPKQRVVIHFGAGKYIPGEHGPPIRSGEFHLVYEPDQKLVPTYAKVMQRVKHLFLRSKGAQNTCSAVERRRSS